MKKILLFIICIISIFTLTGCVKKKVINTEEFKQAAEKKGYTVHNVKFQYVTYDSIKDATAIMKDNDFQIVFLVFGKTEDAKKMFNNKKDAIDAESSGEVNMINYSTYSVISNDNYYMHLGRVENTLMYTYVPREYEKEAIEFIKSLGYL